MIHVHWLGVAQITQAKEEVGDVTPYCVTPLLTGSETHICTINTLFVSFPLKANGLR